MGSIGTCFGIDLKGNKIIYFSPDFGGFTFRHLLSAPGL